MTRRPSRRAPSRRSGSGERKARYRRRLKQGRMCLGLDVGGAHVEMLCCSHWLPRRDTYDRQEIKEALQALIDDMAHSLK